MLKSIYNQSITILNKLPRTGGSGSVDVWYKTYLNESAAWYREADHLVKDDSGIIMTYNKILIPFNNKYLEPLEWKKESLRANYFTISLNDYIILGSVIETITPENVISVIKSYGESACQVKHHVNKFKRFGATVQLEIEGV